jgi:integrase
MIDASDPTALAPLANSDAAAAAERFHEAGRRDRGAQSQFVALFSRWCDDHGLDAAESAPSTLRYYLCALAEAGQSPGSIRNAERSIRRACIDRGLPNPGLHGDEGEQMSALLRGITKNHTEPRKQAIPMKTGELVRAVTYDHRTRTVRRNHTILTVARALELPTSCAAGAQIVGISESGVRLTHPVPNAAGRRSSRSAEVTLAPGDGTLIDPHRQLIALLEVMTPSERDSQIGRLGSKPDTPLNTLVGRAFGRDLAQVNDKANSVADLDDVEMLTLLRNIDSGWLARLQMDAMVVLLFAGALRGVEGRNVRVEHWRHRTHEHGVTLLLPTSKSDPDHEGSEVEIVSEFGGPDGLRPVDIVDRWIDAAQLRSGDLLFPSMQGVCTRRDRIDGRGRPITQQTLIARLANLGIAIDVETPLTGHSCRRGFATAAANAGISLEQIQAHLRHARIETLALYIERYSPGVHGRAVADGILRSLGRDF